MIGPFAILGATALLSAIDCTSALNVVNVDPSGQASLVRREKTTASQSTQWENIENAVDISENETHVKVTLGGSSDWGDKKAAAPLSTIACIEISNSNAFPVMVIGDLPLSADIHDPPDGCIEMFLDGASQAVKLGHTIEKNMEAGGCYGIRYDGAGNIELFNGEVLLDSVSFTPTDTAKVFIGTYHPMDVYLRKVLNVRAPAATTTEAATTEAATTEAAATENTTTENTTTETTTTETTTTAANGSIVPEDDKPVEQAGQDTSTEDDVDDGEEDDEDVVPPSMYFVGNKSTTCPSGSTSIVSRDDCSAALDDLGLDKTWIQVEESNDSIPRGCIESSEKAIFNNVSVGAPDADWAPICVRVDDDTGTD